MNDPETESSERLFFDLTNYPKLRLKKVPSWNYNRSMIPLMNTLL